MSILDLILIPHSCIIQDSPSDKESEICKMHAIYRNAALTIVAARSETASHGFLTTSRPSYYLEPSRALTTFDVAIEISPHQSVSVSFRPPPEYRMDEDPISKRAWALQEHLMPRHLAIFGTFGMEMVCRDMHRSDPTLAIRSRPITSGFDQPLRYWWTIRSNYTNRQLTDPNDKLLAISSVAQEIAPYMKGRYLAGLWEKNLFEDLQWSTPEGYNTARPKIYRAPSWSWASTDLPINRELSYAYINASSICRIEKCEVQLSRVDSPYGAVSSGHLQITGVHRKFNIERSHSFPYFWGEIEGVTDDIDQQWRGGITFDAIDEDEGSISTEVTFFGISLGKWWSPSGQVIQGLVLVPVDGGFYRRIGLFYHLEKTLLDGCEEKTFTII
jgi:hypothetical protein